MSEELTLSTYDPSTTKLEFPKSLLPVFEHKLAILNRKLAKINGVDAPITLNTQEYSVKKYQQNGLLELDETRVQMLRVEAFLPATLSLKKLGFVHMGTISSRSGAWTIYNPSENQEFIEIANEVVKHDGKVTCSHCHGKRDRVAYHIFFEESTKKVHRIGSACAREYFGFDLNRALDMWYTFEKEVNDLEEDRDYGRAMGKKIVRGKDINLVIEAAKLVYADNSQWRKSSYEDSSSGSDIGFILFSASAEAEKYRKFLAAVPRYKKLPSYDEIRAKLVEMYADVDTSNSFNWNIKSALFKDGELRDFVANFGIVGYTVFKAIHAISDPDQDLHKKYEKKVPSVAIGKIGDKVELKFAVDNLREYNGGYGRSTIVSGMVGTDKVSFFSTAKWVDELTVGDNITIKGTVKKHNEYNGNIQTNLNRVKKV